MPNLDGTGPQGQGPLTGRRRGRCRDSEKSEAQQKAEKSGEVIYGLGRGGRPKGGGGFGKGHGQGRRRGYGRNQTFGK
ncbi:MAG TPA: DUF5320 domain-containing protein [Ignavibacteriaceae bacterium]|nr:DUF5320 domain-containing protein [Ignavibacteriaceae bacterium]